jgi:methyl-accepting chemotaxis protein
MAAPTPVEAATVIPADHVTDPLTDPLTDPGGPARALLSRWLDLSELERRAFVALTRELIESSDLVEVSTLDLSERFQSLAAIAHSQVSRVEAIIEVARFVRVDGETVALDQAMHTVEDVLLKVIETILSVSKHAMRMVYALDDVTRDVESAEQCATQIEKINTQTRYLALNAAIEANRSGHAGAAFGVIAHEMKALSQATEETARQVRDRISLVARGMRNGHKVLQEIATLDMSEHILAKQRLDSLLAGILAQNREFGSVLGEAAASSADMARTIAQMVMSIQFQDRTKQHIAQVVDALNVLGEGNASVARATLAAYPDMPRDGGVDADLLARILERQTLGGMKQRVLALLLAPPDATHGAADGAPEPRRRDGAAPDVVDDIELF